MQTVNAFVIASSMMAAVSLYAGLYYLWMHLRRPDAPENLSFSLTCFSMALYDIFSGGLYGAASVQEGMAWQKLQFASLALFSIFFTWFILHFSGGAFRRFAWSITSIMGLLLLLGLVIEGDITLVPSRPMPKTADFFGIANIIYHEADPGLLYRIQYGAMLAGFPLLLVLLMRDRPGRRRGRSLLLSMAVFFAAALNDVLVGTGAYSFIYVLEYAYLVILIAMTRDLLDGLLALQREVEELNTRLEQKVRERSMALLFSEISARTGAASVHRGGARTSTSGENGKSGGTLAPMLELARDLGEDIKGSELPANILQKALETGAAEYGYLFLAGEEGELRMAANAETGKSAGGAILAYRRQVVDVVFARGKAVITGDSFSPRSVLVAPLSLHGTIIGVCYMGRRHPGFTGLELESLSSFLEYAALLLRGTTAAKTAGADAAVTDFCRERVLRAITYIDENYRFDISREGLAASLGISPHYLGKAFKEITGKKLGDYLNSVRICEAARRLAGGAENVIDIAYAVGFETLRTFNRAFRREMGMSPSEYRERKR